MEEDGGIAIRGAEVAKRGRDWSGRWESIQSFNPLINNGFPKFGCPVWAVNDTSFALLMDRCIHYGLRAATDSH